MSHIIAYVSNTVLKLDLSSFCFTWDFWDITSQKFQYCKVKIWITSIGLAKEVSPVLSWADHLPTNYKELEDTNRHWVLVGKCIRSCQFAMTSSSSFRAEVRYLFPHPGAFNLWSPWVGGAEPGVGSMVLKSVHVRSMVSHSGKEKTEEKIASKTFYMLTGDKHKDTWVFLMNGKWTNGTELTG